ncbi:MAG: RecB family exonuclease [Campylobacterales bacterium]
MPAKEAAGLDTHLLVVPTARARREYYRHAQGPTRKILAMDEFESRLAVVAGRTFIDETTRLLLLREASRFDAYEQLGIPRDFLVFLEHAPFFLRFFDELAYEGVQPDALLSGDTYAEYDEHIAVLKTLQARYRALLDARGYADAAVLCEGFEINRPWLEQFESIEIHIEGALSRFEHALLRRAAALRPLTLQLHLTPFDQKTAEAFAPLPLKTGHLYRLDLGAQKIEQETPLAGPKGYRVYAVKERLAQAAAVQQAVFELADRGFDPARIAVVLPDESFASVLHRFDRHRIFNFAMGFSLKFGPFYALLSALHERLKSTDLSARLRFERLCKTRETLASVSAPFFEQPKRRPSKELLGWLQPLCALADETELPKVQEALFTLENILQEPENLTPAELLHLFMEQVGSQSLDDAGSGAVTVMGVLETRATAFDAVIVADFNEGFVPKESVKDMFLSAQVRASAGLPTRTDRADLQRSLYWRLFAAAKERIIFCVQNDAVKPSRFLAELGIQAPPEPFNPEASLLFTPKPLTQVRDESAIELEIDLSQKPLSASMFKSYLTCKRQFYHRYIERLKDQSVLNEPQTAQSIGTCLHAALAEGYQASGDIPAIKRRVLESLRAQTAGDARLAFEAQLWQRRLEAFFERESVRAAQGWRPLFLEENFTAPYGGLLLNGRVDRVDRNEAGELCVLDYKSGALAPVKNPEKQKDFQLLFYRLLLQAQGHDDPAAAYYELQSGELHYLEEPETHQSVLDARLSQYKAPHQRFDRCESRAPCRFCEFKLLCDRAV